MTCDHAGHLMGLPGWQTLWCPICDRGTTLELKTEFIPEKTVVPEKKPSGLAAILAKNKSEQSQKKCKCRHDESNTDPCVGDYLNCEWCKANCIPF